MITPNPRMLHVQQSATFAAKERVLQLRAQGKRVVDMTFGEPELDTPEHIKEAAFRALKEGKTKYTAVGGIAELRAGLAKKMSDRLGRAVASNEIIATNGGKQAIHECMSVLLQDGEKVGIISPYWVSYPEMIYLSGGVPHIIKTKPENGWRLTVPELEAGLKGGVKILILNSPCNPTGVAYTDAEMKAFGEVLKRHECFIISDDVYEQISFQGRTFPSLGKLVPEIAPRLISISSFSKTYSMTGWRVGWAHGTPEIIDLMVRFQSQATSSINTPAQYGALAAVTGDDSFAKMLSKRYEERISFGVSQLTAPGTLLQIPAKPEGTYYLFVRATELMKKKGIKDSKTLATQILEKAGVSVVTGDAFGDGESFRLSVTTQQEDFEFAMKQLAALDKLL